MLLIEFFSKSILLPAAMPALCIMISLSGCSGQEKGNQLEPAVTENVSERTDQEMDWKITSPSFNEGESIPAEFTCTGQDVSPALSWTDPPEGTQELALIMDDPDAPMGTWTHWILYSIPPDTRELPENMPTDEELSSPPGAKQGITDFRRPGYGGPCPPSGEHRYFFKLFALDQKMEVPPGASLKQVSEAMDGHIIAETRLMGVFSK